MNEMEERMTNKGIKEYISCNDEFSKSSSLE